MQTASTRIWTQVVKFISYDDKCYATCFNPTYASVVINNTRQIVFASCMFYYGQDILFLHDMIIKSIKHLIWLSPGTKLIPIG